MIRFYYGSGSPWAWRVQLVLEEKGLAYEPQLMSFGDGDLRTPEFLAMNPHGKVPVLVDRGATLYESQPILEYLEERYPEPRLLGGDAAGRAAVRIEEAECTAYMGEAFLALARAAFFPADGQRDEVLIDRLRGEARAELGGLEERARGRGGEFVMGEDLTRADTTWIPFVEIVGRAGVHIDAAGLPWTTAWRDRMRARESYRNSFPPHWRS